MKGFDEQFPLLAKNTGIINTSESSMRRYQEDGWRAAYESILKEIDSRVSPNISEIARIIKQELGDEAGDEQ